jgi:23S rRNA pseudouridine1911/1915/1917 synthase
VVASEGLPDEGEVGAVLAPDRDSRRRVKVVSDAPPKSGARRTRYVVLERRGAWALLEVSVSRAYRHQIRAHLAHIGHPIAGDAVYGGEPVAALGGRHALHASYVAWAGDATVVGFTAEDALPPELGSLMAG